MIKGEIEIQKTARYYLSADSKGKFSKVCFALHGYGQLASFFCKKLENKALQDTLFICPEGLHRFYLKDSSGRVGSSWMTKEDRLVDIADYVKYLDQVYLEFKPLFAEVEKVGILGFSQGVATACRWLAFSENKFDFLINWAGAFPPDLPFEKAISKMKNIPCWMVLGNEDEYITEIQFKEHLASLEKEGFQPKSKSFIGNHSIKTEVLQELLETI